MWQCLRASTKLCIVFQSICKGEHWYRCSEANCCGSVWLYHPPLLLITDLVAAFTSNYVLQASNSVIQARQLCKATFWHLKLSWGWVMLRYLFPLLTAAEAVTAGSRKCKQLWVRVSVTTTPKSNTAHWLELLFTSKSKLIPLIIPKASELIFSAILSIWVLLNILLQRI